MVRIAPVKMSFNPRVLWFDAKDLELKKGDYVIVQTARGHEFGQVAEALFDAQNDQLKALRSPLKPVCHKADEEDLAQNEEMIRRSKEAMPIFRQLVEELVPEMRPVSVEYLFSGDKAVFYFEADDRVDFRDLVRRLASEFHLRVDMKQIGVRDAARMIGGIGHCGQELCCCCMGGEFSPVSIRMAKEQDLSLNPQKISGLCGRLMCCLRYEFDAYKDFHDRAPKKGACVRTPDGEGSVVDLDVPREIVHIKVGDESPVKVPLADMKPTKKGGRPCEVGVEAWEEANEPELPSIGEALHLFSTSKLTGNDKLAEPGYIKRMSPKQASSTKLSDTEGKSHRRRRTREQQGDRGASSMRGEQKARASQKQIQDQAQPRKHRRRSTTVNAQIGEQRPIENTQVLSSIRKEGASQSESMGQSMRTAHDNKKQPRSHTKHRSRRQSQKANNDSTQNKGQKQARSTQSQNKVQVGRNSSALRADARRNSQTAASSQQLGEHTKTQISRNKRRRRREGRSES